MKKLSEKHQRHLWQKSLRGNRKSPRYDYSQLLSGKILQLPKAKIKFKNGKALIVAPTAFNLSQNAEEVLDFLRLFRQVVSLSFPIHLDFTKIESLSPMCALLLTSEIDRWRKFGLKRLRVVDRDDWSPVVKSLLHQMGFNDLINPADTFYMQADPNNPVKYLRLQSGTYGDAEVAEKLAINIAQMAGNIEHSHLLHEGLTEAMINSKKWAYKDETPDNQKRWWLTASYNTQTKVATVMIYDHGQGIPKTVPTSGLLEYYKSFLEGIGIFEPDDAYWIKAAMTVGRTASGLKNRGKGLRDIQQFVLASKKGTLRIVSGKGEYVIDEKGNDTPILHDTALNGTLIAWQVTLEDQNNDEFK